MTGGINEDHFLYLRPWRCQDSNEAWHDKDTQHYFYGAGVVEIQFKRGHFYLIVHLKPTLSRDLKIPHLDQSSRVNSTQAKSILAHPSPLQVRFILEQAPDVIPTPGIGDLAQLIYYGINREINGQLIQYVASCNLLQMRQKWCRCPPAQCEGHLVWMTDVRRRIHVPKPRGRRT
ncbi:hypothetical protein JTE90_027308 [Oedothorax gibbosus]|uniref:Uncharacterized protein n=1 Tax=Oedothorax gibbosus TaxID=931172 RepID=A0AAV6W325_9ARAC|nr:hypothetical protein JTE90_027308 [Oedothorax gibbosus]